MNYLSLVGMTAAVRCENLVLHCMSKLSEIPVDYKR